MTVTAAERLRQVAELLPPGASVTVPREALLEALNGLPTGGDLTVEQLARRLGRSPSTVRSWLQTGVLAGYRFRRRQWRVPPAAIAEFEQRERDGEPRRTPTGDTTDLAAWRKETA